MILWFCDRSGNPTSIEEFKSYIDRIDPIKLKHINLCYWEEAEMDLRRLFYNDSAYELLADILEKINQNREEKVELRIFTCPVPPTQPVYYDKSNPRFRYIREIYLTNSLFFRTQYRLGPYKNHDYAYREILSNTGLDITNLHTGLDYINYKYDYIYMALLPKPPRCQTMDSLAKYNLHEFGAISWREFNRDLKRSEIPEGMMDSEFMEFPWKYWKPKRIFLDQEFENPGPINWDLLPIEYTQSFMQIVGESITHDGIQLISEKTIVPLMFNKPFLAVCSQNFHYALQDIGFELYTEIFDYTFDHKPDVYDRIEGICKNVLELRKRRHEQGDAALLHMLKEKLIHNKKLAHSITVDPKFIPEELTDFLNHGEYMTHDKAKTITPKIELFPYLEYAVRFNNLYLHE